MAFVLREKEVYDEENPGKSQGSDDDSIEGNAKTAHVSPRPSRGASRDPAHTDGLILSCFALSLHFKSAKSSCSCCRLKPSDVTV